MHNLETRVYVLCWKCQVNGSPKCLSKNVRSKV